MKRFRFTLIAVCLILGWLGYSDLRLLLTNPEPLDISVKALSDAPPPREWLTIADGYRDLTQAINMSGSFEIDAFLVPLLVSPDAKTANIWVETRDAEIIELLKTYYFSLDTEEERQAYLDAHRNQFSSKWPVTGMTAGNLVANANQQKLEKLLLEMDIPLQQNTIFISEGKTPTRWRGVVFLGLALIGLAKIIYDGKQGARKKAD